MNINLPTSRDEARTIKSVAYFTGRACQNNHVEPRYTNTGICYQCKRERAKRDYKIHASRINTANKRYADKNPEKIAKSKQVWALNNLDKVNQSRAKYKTNNREKHLESNRRYMAKKRESPIHRLSAAVSLGIWKYLKTAKSGKKWQTLVNFTLDQLIIRLESQFTPKMHWANYGSYWEIDHIKPKSKCATFEEAWDLANLQPLSVTVNRQKQAQFPYLASPPLNLVLDKSNPSG